MVLISFKDLKNLDYEKIGFRCGLEIHQQLDTGKLFCNCPSKIVPNETLNLSIRRKLRFSISETGNIDEASLDEFKKNKEYIYKYNNEVACLVELDEEPPHEVNKKAFLTALKVALILNLNIFDKIQFMRKLIIDGSITSGYQRTALLGIKGKLETPLGEVGINAINLEEDSCRILERKEKEVIFSLDRQGIPLIEITTDTDIKNPKHLKETALQIGNVLRSFKEVKRGLGTIRQDLNISVKDGSRVEIKGAQNLKKLDEIAINEIKRQLVLITLIEEFKKRGLNRTNFTDNKIHDLTEVFLETNSNIIKKGLNENKRIYGMKFNNFKELFGLEILPNYRFGTEISNKNKLLFPEVKGLFHGDELPNYGISENELKEIYKKLNLSDNDSFILVILDESKKERLFENLIKIISEFFSGLPEEVRQVFNETLTKPLRKMPGSARMYPETDVPNLDISKNLLNNLKKELPELLDVKIKRLSKLWNLENSKIKKIIENDFEEEFNFLIKNNFNSNKIYSMFFEIVKELNLDFEIIKKLDKDILLEIMKLLSENKMDKKLVGKLFLSLSKNKNIEFVNLDLFLNYLKKNNLILNLNEKEIEEEVKKFVENNKDAPFNALMGMCMKKFGGKVSGRLISDLIKKNLN